MRGRAPRDPSITDRFPYLIDVVEELTASGYDPDRQFERGLASILDAIGRLRQANPPDETPAT